MKSILMSLVLFFVSLILAACSGNANNQTATDKENHLPNKSANLQEAKTDEKSKQELQNQIERTASEAAGRVGVMATLLETGETVSLDPGGHFPMQSVYKFPIAMALLARVDSGQIKLEQTVRVEKSDFVRRGMHSPIRDRNPEGAEVSVSELLRLAVSESDGTASDVLLNLAGGAEAVGKYLGELGVTEIVVANSEKEIGRDWETQYRNWASPAGAVNLLRALHEGRGLSEPSRAFLLKLMMESSTGPRRLKGLLPKDAVVAHKTGTSGTEDGVTAATNDIGIITLPDGRHLAIAVFVSDSRADEATREAVIAKVAKAVWDKWSK